MSNRVTSSIVPCPLESNLPSSRRLVVSFPSRSVSKRMIPRYFSCDSGGIVPSSMASTYPFIEVSGERKSCDTLETNLRWSSSRVRSSFAM